MSHYTRYRGRLIRQLAGLLLAFGLAACSHDSGANADPKVDPLNGRPEPGVSAPPTDVMRQLFTQDQSPFAAVASNASARAAARRLVRLQADSIGDSAGNGYVDDDPDDGGWDFEVSPSSVQHSIEASTSTTYGGTAMGVLAAYIAGGSRDADLLTSCIDAYLGLEKRPNSSSGQDLAYLPLLTFVTNNPGYQALGRERYDAKVAELGGPQAFGERVRDALGQGGQDGLIPYVLGWLVLASSTLDAAYPGQGYLDHATIYGTIIASDIRNPAGYFNSQDPNERMYTVGLAWAAIGVGVSLVDGPLWFALRRTLADYQQADGSWLQNATATEGDGQSTAAAVLSFALGGLSGTARETAQAGANWLATRQVRSTGGFQYLPGKENTLFDAEIVLALSLVPPPASPASSPIAGAKNELAAGDAALSPFLLLPPPAL